MTETTLSPAVTFATAGELLTLDGETFVLWSACGAAAPTLACLTCRQRLANQGQLEMHTETGCAHRIAAWCQRHGWEALA